MYKVIVIDDEKMSLVSTEHSFKWDINGFSIFSTFTNPYDAIQCLKSQRIDVAFVDLRMPELSGLDIITLCKEENINTEFVIISGYSDFQYAQKAIQLNVFEYCLKPIQVDQISGLLPKLGELLYGKRIIEDSAYIQDIIEGDNTSSILSYLTLDVEQKNFWVVGVSSENLKNVISKTYARSQIFLMISNQSAVVIYADGNDITERLNNEYASMEKGGAIISSSFNCLQNTSQALRCVCTKLKSISPNQNIEVTNFNINDSLNINKSFLSLMDFINANYNQDLSLMELSKKFNISYTYCSELFKKVTKTNYFQYIMNLRLADACELLEKSNISINDISYNIGYNNYHYFANVFKKNIGLTPSKYRQKLKEAKDQYEI